MKKIITFLFGIIIILGNTNLTSAATNKPTFEINSMRELKNSIQMAEKSKLNDEIERLFILKNTNPLVLETYTKNFFQEAADAISRLSKESMSTDIQLPINLKKNRMELPNGGVVQSLVIDQAEEDILNNVSTMNNTFATTEKIYVATVFGNRIYTASFNVYHFLYPDTRLRLVNRYSVSSNGLVMTSVSTAGTMAIFPTTVKIRTVEITDKYAQTAGNDINGLAEFNVTIGGYNGIGLMSFNTTIISTIKLTSLTSKTATIEESRIVDHLDQVITD